MRAQSETSPVALPTGAGHAGRRSSTPTSLTDSGTISIVLPPWFRPGASREAVLALLDKQPGGTFVIRPDTELPGSFIINVARERVAGSDVWQGRIESDQGMYYFTDQRMNSFPSLEALVSHYSKCPYAVDDKGVGYMLRGAAIKVIIMLDCNQSIHCVLDIGEEEGKIFLPFWRIRGMNKQCVWACHSSASNVRRMLSMAVCGRIRSFRLGSIDSSSAEKSKRVGSG